MKAWLVVACAVALATPVAAAKVTYENLDNLPPGCDGIAGELDLTVRAGRKYAAAFPGAVFAFDNATFDVPPCTQVNVRFVNEDKIRHQFMVHGAWPKGFFQIELTGPAEETGSFISGATPKTRLVHCGILQHQQKGMKAQLLVAGGEGTLPNLLGVSGIPLEDRWWTDEAAPATPVEATNPVPTPTLLGALLVALSVAAALRRRPDR